MTRVAVSTVGEAMLRLSVRPGERLLDAPAYQVHVAGSEANVAHALSKIGVKAAWSSVLPKNKLGERVANTLRAAGVDLQGLVWSDAGRVGTYFVELSSEPRPTSVVYDRAGSAISQAAPGLFDWDTVCDAQVLHLSGITLGLAPGGLELGRTALQEARRRGLKTSLDVNYRALLWSPEAAANALRDLKGSFDLVISTAEDARDLFGLEGDPTDITRRLQDELGAAVVALTEGGEGARVVDGGEHFHRPAHRVLPVDRIGAGDAFAAGLLWGWLEGSLEAGLERGLAMAALKMTLQGDLFTLDATDVHRLLQRAHREVHR